MKQASAARDRAILCLSVLGLRASEISGCDAAWVDFANRTIAIPPRAAKRGKGRVVPFGKIKVICDVAIAFFAGLPISSICFTRRIALIRIGARASSVPAKRMTF